MLINPWRLAQASQGGDVHYIKSVVWEFIHEGYQFKNNNITTHTDVNDFWRAVMSWCKRRVPSAGQKLEQHHKYDKQLEEAKNGDI